jgi:LmbE family N-acetylglucosaminyl deacetylase
MDLIISPHVDDEVLGCGGILNNTHVVLHCGLSENQLHGKNNFSREFRLAEFKEIEALTGCSSKLLDHPVNNYSCNELIKDFEEIINTIKPDKLYLASPSYNQDHKAAYDAALIALRPHDINFFVKKVLVYEQPQDFWDSGRPEFKPNYFIPINIDKKTELYKKLNSQVRGHRSTDHIKTIAKLRGMQINVDYAESFEILRWVD